MIIKSAAATPRARVTERAELLRLANAAQLVELARMAADVPHATPVTTWLTHSKWRAQAVVQASSQPQTERSAFLALVPMYRALESNVSPATAIKSSTVSAVCAHRVESAHQPPRIRESANAFPAHTTFLQCSYAASRPTTPHVTERSLHPMMQASASLALRA